MSHSRASAPRGVQDTPAAGDPRVRAAVDSDAAAVSALLALAGLPPLGDTTANVVIFVAEAAGRVAGSAALETYADAGLLRSVAIDEALRSTGIGRQLVERAIGEAAAQALDSVYLLTTTAESYFKRFGFESISRDEVQGLIRRSREFATLCPASAVAMRLVIAQP